MSYKIWHHLPCKSPVYCGLGLAWPGRCFTFSSSHPLVLLVRLFRCGRHWFCQHQTLLTVFGFYLMVEPPPGFEDCSQLCLYIAANGCQSRCGGRYSIAKVNVLRKGILKQYVLVWPIRCLLLIATFHSIHLLSTVWKVTLAIYNIMNIATVPYSILGLYNIIIDTLFTRYANPLHIWVWSIVAERENI